jgi:hypothetical protein
VLRDAILTVYQRATVVALSHEPRDAEVSQATTAVNQAERVVVITRDARDLPSQVELARRIIAGRLATTPVLHVAARGPYDAGLLPEATATLLTYGDPAVSLRALVDVLAGDTAPSWTLPVALPGHKAV